MAESEFQSLMKMIEEMYGSFNLEYRLRFGTRPEKFIGEASDWDFAEDTLRSVLEKSGKEFFTVEGEGAFYGPKVDILMKDSLGREWQTGTIQLDVQQPKRFGLVYTDSDGTEKMPFVYHRAIFGSFERFLGILIEHYMGKFPIWLSPLQIVIIPISEDQNEIAEKASSLLLDANIKAVANTKHDTMQSKIREATLQKVPYMCIIGRKEQEASSDAEVFVAVRTRSGENLGTQTLSSFKARILEDIERKL
jgi:threonyl-tRNA synthetase